MLRKHNVKLFSCLSSTELDISDRVELQAVFKDKQSFLPLDVLIFLDLLVDLIHDFWGLHK